MAIVLREPMVEACIDAIEKSETLISSGTLAEALIVAAGRGVTSEMQAMFDRIEFEIVPVTAAEAQRVGKAYRRWGKGFHPAGLNFGDCFAYSLAKERGRPLLYVGNDFARTDIESAL